MGLTDHIYKVHYSKEKKSQEEKLINATECKTCKKEFRYPNIYINHYQEKHGSVPPEYVNETLFFCEKCSKAYLSKTQLTDHIYKVHYSKEKKSQKEKSINATECKTCEKEFRYPNIDINHYQEKH